MIINLDRFISRERGYWLEFESMLGRLQRDPNLKLSLKEVSRLHYLYQRASADLARLSAIPGQSTVKNYLETLVAEGYSEVHSGRGQKVRFAPIRWFLHDFPRAFRAHYPAFALALGSIVLGSLFGAGAIVLDKEAKEVIIPFGHLMGDPSERVEREEARTDDPQEGVKMAGAAGYMTHNTKVSIFVMALGATWGIGTLLMLFYNGVILGAVGMDYILAGQADFLLGWLTPHGAVEIPAIVLAGQAGLVLGSALIGWGDRTGPRTRLRRIGPHLLSLIFGVAVLLTWAGIIESFVSQYHEPVLPYIVKITFGAVEFIALCLLLAFAGKNDFD